MGLESENDAYEEHLVKFADRAGRFLRTGGCWGWATFQSFSEDEQEIAARLADELEARRAVDCGRALTPEGAAAVLAPYDEGKSVAEVALSGFMDRLGA